MNDKTLVECGLLTDEEFAGKVPVKVFNKTSEGKDVLEGMARIRKIHQGDRQGVHASVCFIGDAPGDTFDRWVFGSKQSNRE